MKKILINILVLVLLGALGSAFYFYKQASVLRQNPQAAADEEAEDLVSKVGRLIILPKDELPTIATVSDPAKLADQPFFAKAKVGDKVLIYTQAKKAYLYDPVAHRILEVAPLNVETDVEGGGFEATNSIEEDTEAEVETQ